MKKDVNNVEIRRKNTKNRILYLIREHRKISKTELLKQTGYSMTTILSTINELVDAGLVSFGEKGITPSGRKPVYISLNPDGGYFVGISFTAARMSGAILNYRGEIIYHFQISLAETKLSVEYVLENLSRNLLDMLEKIQDKRDRIIGIGIGVPGYYDEDSSMSIFYPHIPGWRNVDLTKYLRSVIPDFKIRIEPNVNGMALAYNWLRPEYRGLSYIVISITSGIRMACVFNNVLYKGSNFTAGEIGHIRVNGGRRYCPCGKTGCLESEVSESAILERILEGLRANRFAWIWEAAEKNQENITTDLFIKGVLAQDSDCLALLDELCSFLGEAIAHLLNTLNPDKIILSCKLNQLGDQFLGRIYRYAEGNAIFAALKNFTLETTDFGETLAAVGAASIVMNHELSYVDAII